MAVRGCVLAIVALIGLLIPKGGRMPVTTIYGPQAWTAGHISTSAWTSAVDSNYPELYTRERVETRDGLGPNGERILDTYQANPDYGVGQLLLMEFGPSGGYWDVNAGGGTYYEADVLFSSAAAADTDSGDFLYPFGIGLRNPAEPRGSGGGQFEILRLNTSFATSTIYAQANGFAESGASGPLGAIDDQWHRIKVFLRVSDGFTADGIIRVWIDDVLVIEKTDSLIYADFGSLPVNHANYVFFGYYGLLPITNFHIYYGEEDPIDLSAIPTDESTPCCGSSVNPNTGGGVGGALGENPYQALQPWTPSCAGGGTVPSASDLTDSEDWSL